MNSNVPQLVAICLAAVLGAAAGGIYFGGLWWTVRRMPAARHPWALYLASVLGRLALVLGILGGVLALQRWPLVVAMLSGFLLARLALTRWLGRVPATAGESGNAG